MAIYVDSCSPQETIVVTTRSNLYEVVILRGDRGDVLSGWKALYRDHACAISRFDGRRWFAEITHHRYRSPHEVRFGARVVITSPVQSLSCGSADVALECVAVQ